ncbi:hypothetical protein Tco_0544391, partial [Tanacetum coccineum]
VALSEAAQLKEDTKQSKKDSHISHASGSGDGTNFESARSLVQMKELVLNQGFLMYPNMILKLRKTLREEDDDDDDDSEDESDDDKGNDDDGDNDDNDDDSDDERT